MTNSNSDLEAVQGFSNIVSGQANPSVIVTNYNRNDVGDSNSMKKSIDPATLLQDGSQLGTLQPRTTRPSQLNVSSSFSKLAQPSSKRITKASSAKSFDQYSVQKSSSKNNSLANIITSLPLVDKSGPETSNSPKVSQVGSSKSIASANRKLYNSNGSLAAIIDMVKTQDSITAEGGVSMEKFIEKYEDNWVASIIKSGECTVAAEIEKIQDGFSPFAIVASDSIEALQKLAAPKSHSKDQPEKDHAAFPASFRSSIKNMFIRQSSKKSLDLAVITTSLAPKDSPESPDSPNIDPSFRTKDNKTPYVVSNGSSRFFASDEKLQSTSPPPLTSGPGQQKSVPSPEMTSYDSMVDAALNEEGDNVLPLTISIIKLHPRGNSAALSPQSSSSNSHTSSTSFSQASSTSYSHASSASYSQASYSYSYASFNRSGELINEDSMDTAEAISSRKAVQKLSLMERLKSTFIRRKSKKSSNITAKRDSPKLPPDFKPTPILKPCKPGAVEAYIDPNIYKMVNANPNSYKFTRTPQSEINYDTKRVGFSPTAIDITEAIRVTEMGETPGQGKGVSAVLQVNFVPRSTRIKQD